MLPAGPAGVGDAVRQRLPDRILAPGIGPGRIKIGKASRQEFIHHGLDLLYIDDLPVFRQSHKPETQFFYILSQI